LAWRLFVLVLAGHTRCAAAVQTDPASAPNDAATIIRSPELTKLPRPVQIAWTTHAAMSAVAFVTTRDLSRGPNDFVPQVTGRRMLAAHWKKEQQKLNAPANLYLDQLVRLEAAGFMNELVLTTLSEPGWTVPKATLAALNFDAFETWMREHWQGERTVTLAHYVYLDDPSTTAVIGDSLPANASCAEARKVVAAAAPNKHTVSAVTRSELLAALRAAPRAQDLVWVSPKVAAACRDAMRLSVE
jgi:hypothetical protein